MNDLTTIEAPARAPRVYMNVEEAVAILDTSRFEHMQRIATAMATSSLIPECLRGERDDKEFSPFSLATVISNCFLVTEQAVRWNMSPFAVAQTVSIVRGKLMYEGKLVAAVLQSRLSIDLDYQFGRWDAKTESCIVGEEGQNDLLAVRVVEKGVDDPRDVHGSVGSWKSAGASSPWKPGSFKRMLRYRGAREWSRAYEPGVMLGVITDDEMHDLVDRRFANVAAGPRPTLSAGFGEEQQRERLEAPRTPAKPEPADDIGQLDDARTASAGAQAGHDPKTGEVLDADPLLWNGVRYQNKSRLTEAKRIAAAAAKAANGSDKARATPDATVNAETSSPPAQDDRSSGGPVEGQVETVGLTTAVGAQEDDTFPGDRVLGGGVVAETVNPMVAVMARLPEAASWDAIVAELRALALTPEWKAAAADSKKVVRLEAWARFCVLRDSGEERIDVTQNFSLFRLWLDFGATSVEEIELTWPTFWRSEIFRNAPEIEKKAIMSLCGERKAALATAA